MKTDINAPEGTCQFCQCTEANACRLATGDPCCWMSKRRNCCNNPQCIASWHAGLPEPAKAKPKLRSADIHQLIRSRGKKKPRKRMTA